MHDSKQCTLRRAHSPHSWWSRKLQRYFQCPGNTYSKVVPR